MNKISIKTSHKGLLHRDLSMPSYQPISTEKLMQAKKSASPAVRKRATFAMNARKWNH